MPSQPPPFFARLWLAIVCLFRIVFDLEFATGVQALREAPALPLLPEKIAQPETPAAISARGVERSGQALHLLAVLQREGRLLDFCEEDLAGFSDAQIGAAARTVHDGCRKALRDAVTLEAVRPEKEGSAVEVPKGFDPAAVRLTGNVVGQPPFRGALRHHGWRVSKVMLPPPPADPMLLAPAEVELP
jgi:hypothetical protein